MIDHVEVIESFQDTGRVLTDAINARIAEVRERFRNTDPDRIAPVELVRISTGSAYNQDAANNGDSTVYVFLHFRVPAPAQAGGR